MCVCVSIGPHRNRFDALCFLILLSVKALCALREKITFLGWKLAI